MDRNSPHRPAIVRPATLVAIGILALLTLASIQDHLIGLLATRLGAVDLALRLTRDPKLAIKIGNYYFNGGAYHLTVAERAYRRALALQPEIPRAHYQIARIHFLQGDFWHALQEINRELELHPENLRSLYVRGLIRGYRGELAAAEEDFSRFIGWAPREWAGYNDFAWIQAKLGKFREAEKTVLLAFEQLPGERKRNPWLWTSLGVAHLNLKKYNEAKDTFLKALAMTENMSPQYFWSAYPGNDPRGAESAFKQFRATLHFNLGITYEKLGEFGAAVSVYQAYLALLPEGSSLQGAEVERKISELRTKRE